MIESIHISLYSHRGIRNITMVFTMRVKEGYTFKQSFKQNACINKLSQSGVYQTPRGAIFNNKSLS